MVEKGKPNPDIFLLAAEKMQVSASDCIIIEDSLEGIRGGKNAGMKVLHSVEQRQTIIQNINTSVF